MGVVTGKRGAGILVFRGHEVLLGHMGGPFRIGRDAGGVSAPEGELLDLDRAREKILAGQRVFLDRLVERLA